MRSIFTPALTITKITFLALLNIIEGLINDVCNIQPYQLEKINKSRMVEYFLQERLKFI